MSLALKYGDVDKPEKEVGFIYFDAVTKFTKSLAGQISSHPLANGALVSDHYIRQNPKYNLSAVISGVDINTWTYLVRDTDGLIPVNSYDNFSTTIQANNGLMSKWIPDVLGQFFDPEEPSVIMDQTRTDLTPQIESSLIRLMEGFVFDPETEIWKSNAQVVSLFEFDGVLLKNIIPNLVITEITFQESVESGDALVFDMTLEQVTFSALQEVELDSQVVASLSDQAASESKKTNADGSPEVPDTDFGSTGKTSEDLLRERESRNRVVEEEVEDDVGG